ncbi:MULTISPECIES: MarR family winged helix-turn-helix transcriptional regulator [unclassified Thermoactinomyces]|uniref:MarR family winged helix-turn-helix transcriptional regulator n=1 Tax=unclassified Thermoactinomyces TaxID=2634588 RepID=UPI0018DC2DF4|nr:MULTISPECIES: MarR family transcriptional regulator [unclassified Thermoactinomyces]MBH8599297.1 MarR family transcriptional regulator [Thermoactinomyces sp. CICC 10523]MBH8605347.1 MarR family transcriptional regulator [Thermoactinomyces sp. CICC 10522]MBH8608262.1 MarR family transcriptional regulator [Thermoactinomyces sp. CICC 10521]
MDHLSKIEIVKKWRSLHKIYTQVLHELERLLQEKHQLSLSEFHVLLILSEAPGYRMRLQQLANEAGLSQSAMSRLVSRLEDESCGLLRRHICDTDRRGVYTKLTEKGKEQLAKVLPTYQEVIVTSFAKKQHIETLMDLCTIMKKTNE